MNNWLVFAALNGACAVLGASYAAHGAEMTLGDYGRVNFEAASHYQMVHALVLFIIFLLASQKGKMEKALSISAFAFGTGIICFSGGLYVLALTGPSLLGKIVPVGGVAFIFGWLMLAWYGISQRR